MSATGRRAKRLSAQALAGLGIPASRLTVRDALAEAVKSAARAPFRSFLTSLGTILAVATVITTINLGLSANGAVTAVFDAQRATLVTFSDTSPDPDAEPVIGTDSESALRALSGVRAAGLVWEVGGDTYSVGRVAPSAGNGSAATRLALAGATPGALDVLGAKVSDGRLYDDGMVRRADRVALLGVHAAEQLGMTDVGLAPVIYVGGVRLTVVGIVGDAPGDAHLLARVIVPPAVAGLFVSDPPSPTVVVRTSPGAAQTIARQGPYAISVLDPSRIQAAAPPDPTRLREQISGPVTTLLLAIAGVAFAIGIITIANTMLLSVMQRRAEIGLRRSTGASPGHIMALLLAETAVLGCLGAVIGTSLGLALTSLLCALKGWPPVVDPLLTSAAPVAGAVAGAVAGLYPAWRAGRIDPIEALQR
ncbi:ABC transporter permease [Actinocorallia aurea]